jgi:nucleotide-binding universal stress UspA family protein
MNNDVPTAPRFVLLTAIDASPASDRVIAAAIGFARMIPGAEVHIIHVLEDLSQSAPLVRGSIVPPPAAELRRAARELLDRHGRSVSMECPQIRVVTHLAAGSAWRRVVQLAADIQADLVMVGTHDYGAVERFIIGSVAASVVRRASCPVLVVRAKEHQEVPEIEPPCSQCLRVQRETRGATLWCARHDDHHAHARLHYEYPESFAVGSSTLLPDVR